MWMLLSELELRLAAYSRSHGQRDFCLTFEGPLPLQEYFEVIDKHLQV
jgi:Bardet-Biedl syndrome 9 protein